MFLFGIDRVVRISYVVLLGFKGFGKCSLDSCFLGISL